MIACVCAARTQQIAVRALISANARSILSDMSELAIAPMLEDIRLLVSKDVGETASRHDLMTGLEDSPSIVSGDGKASISVGANDVAVWLSSALSSLLKRDQSFVLLIPHAYATKAEIPSLIARNGIPMCLRGEQVYYCLDSSNCPPAAIQSALGTTISMYSVAWMLRESLHEMKAALALVPAFDGDGWVLAGSVEALLPDMELTKH